MREDEGSGASVKISEQAKLKGILEYRIYRNGKLEEEAADENLIVTVGRSQMARLLGGSFTGRNVSQISFGTNGAAPALGNAEITGAYKKAIGSIDYPAAGQVRFNWNLTTSEANGKAILEFGLLCVDNTLFSRRIRESGKPINKESDISLEGSWTIIF